MNKIFPVFSELFLPVPWHSLRCCGVGSARRDVQGTGGLRHGSGGARARVRRHRQNAAEIGEYSSTVFTNTFFLLVNNQQGIFFFFIKKNFPCWLLTNKKIGEYSSTVFTNTFFYWLIINKEIFFIYLFLIFFL